MSYVTQVHPEGVDSNLRNAGRGETFGGVKAFHMALLLGMIMSILMVLSGFMSIGGSTDSTGLVMSVCCFAILLLIVAVVLLVLGVLRFRKGKNEFSTLHRDNVSKGFFCFILAVIMFVLLILIPISMYLSIMNAMSGAGMMTPQGLIATIIAYAVINMIFWMSMALTFYFMIAGIALPGDAAKSKVAILLFLVSGLISLLIVIAATSGTMTPDALNGLMNAQYLIFFLQLIGYLLFFSAYRCTKTAMQRGAIKKGSGLGL
ncbi:MAG: hypothetical protein QCI38_03055 [Candidatus Thermoplasmatota archaeon]|nr:hypothetical protein [Candidatus Thermoplasmatota archaeon]